jgi:hypothetical protein
MRRLDIASKKAEYGDQKASIGVATLTGYPEDRVTIAFTGMIGREFGGFSLPPLD